jgi:arginase
MFNMKNLIIIEAPTNLGLKQLTDAEPGVRKLPAWLKAHGLYDALQPKAVVNVPAPPYSMQLDEQTGVLNADAVAAYSKTLARAVTGALQAGDFPVVIGGDCSILIGCSFGLKSIGNYGLFFLDGHTDYVTPDFSETKAAAGMDLAMVSGSGPAKLTNIDSMKPYFAQQHIFAVGNRCLEADYVKLITDSNIHYHNLYALRQAGISEVVSRFLIAIDNLDGFWVHLDVDVLNNELMPCVDSPQADGLWYAELWVIISPLLSSPKIKGINITILDPHLDPGGVYTKAFVEEFSKMFTTEGN